MLCHSLWLPCLPVVLAALPHLLVICQSSASHPHLNGSTLQLIGHVSMLLSMLFLFMSLCFPSLGFNLPGVFCVHVLFFVSLPFSWLPPVPPALPIFVILPLDVTLDQWHHYPLRSVHFYLTPKLHTSPASSPYSSPFDHRHLLIRNPNCLPFTSRCCDLILPAHLPLYSMCHLTDATFICLQLCVSDYVLVVQGCNNGFDVSQRGWRAPGLAYFASPLLIHPALHGLYPSYPPSTAVV